MTRAPNHHSFEPRDIIGNTRRQDGDFPGRAIAASLAVHAILGLMLLHAPSKQVPSGPATNPIMVRMIEHPVPEPLQPPAPEKLLPAKPESESEPARGPETVTAPESAQPQVAAESSTGVYQAMPATSTEPSVAKPAAALRATVLEQIGNLAVPAGSNSSDRRPWASYGDPIRGLPGARGWLSGYVGSVRARTGQWQELDGTRRTRQVLAEGTVVCTRRRAPTIDELIHPWKATIVTMGSVCGRERPDAPDFTDPRIQPAPARPGVISEARISGRSRS